MPSIYLDNHATTRVDPAVIDAMIPWFDTHYANAGSTTHEAGRQAREEIDQALLRISDYFSVEPDEVVITSGATESNNLAILGVALHPRQKRRKIVSVVTEHQATLGPLNKLRNQGFEIVLLPVQQQGDRAPGVVDMEKLTEVIDDQVALVSIMLANNEIGVLQPIPLIASLCKHYEIPLHTDATQGVGRFYSDPVTLSADLISFSAHKFYGPKGVGGLIVRNANAPLRLAPQIVGGGQQNNLRSGTLNTPGIIGLAAAIDRLRASQKEDARRAWELRNRLWNQLLAEIPGIELNGPTWNDQGTFFDEGWLLGEWRLPNNLNVCFPKVDGQSLMLEAPELAVSSGSACTSAHPEPSHVLRGIGRSEDQARASIRFGIGRFNTEEDIDRAVELLVKGYRKLSSFVA